MNDDSYHFGRSVGNDGFGVPEDNQRLNLRTRRTPKAAGDSAELLGEIVDLMRLDDEKERSFQIIQQTAVTNFQLMAVFNVPFDYNAILVNAVFGVLAVTCSPLEENAKSALFPTVGIVSSSTAYDYLFGASAIICGDTIGSVGVVPVGICPGGQTQRFPLRRAGPVSLWVHPCSYLDERHNINPTRLNDTMEFSGQIMQLRF